MVDLCHELARSPIHQLAQVNAVLLEEITRVDDLLCASNVYPTEPPSHDSVGEAFKFCLSEVLWKYLLSELFLVHDAKRLTRWQPRDGRVGILIYEYGMKLIG